MAPTLTGEAWAQIRCDYEHTERPIEDICAEHGISSGTLRDRMRRWGWTRRRPPIPRQGPPPLPAPPETRPVVRAAPPLAATPAFDVEAVPALDNDSPHPAAAHRQAGAGCVNLPAALGGDPPPTEPERGRAQARPGWGVVDESVAASDAAHAAPANASEDAGPGGTGDDSMLVPRLQGAVARVLPAIETIVARLAAGATHPREMEQAGRALGALTRALRELNGLLDDRRPPEARDGPAGKAAADDEPDEPRDIEEFRQELIRRMNAIVAARTEAAEHGRRERSAACVVRAGRGEGRGRGRGRGRRRGRRSGWQRGWRRGRRRDRETAGREVGREVGGERARPRGPQVRSL